MSKNKHPKPPCTYVSEDGQKCKAYCAGGYQYCIGHAKRLGVWQEPVVEEAAPSIQEHLSTDAMPILVGEHVALTAMREQTASEVARKPVDPREKLQVIDQIRQLMDMAGLTVDEFGQLADANRNFQKREDETDRARQQLIDRTRALAEHTPPEVKAQAEVKAMADVRRAAQGYIAQRQMTALRLKSEPLVEVAGGAVPEEFSINGVGFVIPANGLFRVPRTIAAMLSERRLRKQEKLAKAALLSADHPLEYNELQQKMREVERNFGSTTVDEASEFTLAAEEIKAR